MRISTTCNELLAMNYEPQLWNGSSKLKAQSSKLTLLFAICLLPFVISAQSVISGKVFWDCNNNDVRDIGDAGIKNITVRLLTTDNQQISTITDSVGNYSFNVSNGSYKVMVSLPTGSTQLIFSTRVAGGDPTLNSDVDSSGTSDNLIVVSGTNYTSIDAGIVDKTAPKIQFVNPLIAGFFSGDTLTVSCDNLPRMDSSWVSVTDNSKQTLTAVFTDNLLIEGNCRSNGFVKLLDCTWTATDACGNVGTSFIFVKVIDTIAPVLNNIPANITVNTYLGDTVATAPTNIYALDNCTANTIIPLTYNTVTTQSSCGSTITRTWSSTDGCGNSATNSQVIKVFDTQNCLVVYPIDTFKIELIASRFTDSCVNSIFGTNRTVTSVAFVTPSSVHNLVPLLSNGCLKIMALQTFNKTDTLIGTSCDASGNNCRNFFLIVTPQSLRLNSCNLFNQDTVARIKLANCNDKGYFCISGVNDAIAFKNNYTISDNGTPYTGTLTGCQYDTSFSYTYFTIPRFSKSGPYRLDYWLLNGQSYKITAFRDIFVLVDSMNVWDKVGKWSVDTLTLTISGGKSVNTYGQMKVTCIANGSVSYMEMNSQLNSSGVSVCFFAGTHEVIFKNNSTLCQDILRLVITCDTSVVSKKPHAINDFVTVKKNSLVIFDPTQNDSLFAAPIRTFTIISPPKNGSFAYSGNTSVVYVPTTGFCGNDTLKYAICNNYFLCDTASIFINVTCASDSTPTTQKPIARADYSTTSKNVKVSVNFLANDSPNGALTSTTIIKTPRRGVAAINANKIDYTPNLNDCNYNDTLQYKICNAAGCDSTFVYVAVSCDTIPTGGSKKPVAMNDYITTPKNITIRFKPTANDNINGILNSLSIFETPKHGTIGYIGLDSIIYKPNSDFCGRDTFRYQVGNTAFLFDSAYVFVNVTCGSDSTPTSKKPVAVVDNYTMVKNTSLRFKPTYNDIANGTINSMSVTIQPKNGSVRSLGIDSLIYTPNTNFCGLDSLKYNICNNFNLCDTAFIFINVVCDTPPVPKKPIAVADNATTKKNTLVSIDVLANDTQNGTFIVTSITKNPRRGTAVFNGTKIDYTPQKDSCNYSDTLQYKICNAVGCDSANVTIAVTCDTPTISKKPVAVTDNYTTPKNTTLRFKPTSNDIANGTITSMSVTVSPKNGSVRSLGIDSLIYTPNTNFCGLDSLKYNICNNFNLCDTAFIFIKVACDTPPLPKKPVAVADNATTKKNTLVSIDVLANDTQNGAFIVTSITKNPRRGTAVFNGTKIDYTPQKDSCNYSDTLQYKICNAVGCDSANVIIAVTCDTPTISKKPVAVTDNYTTPKNTTLRFKPTLNDIANGTITSMSVTVSPKNGSVRSLGIDSLIYTPNTNFCGLDSLKYNICNNFNLCDTAFIFIKVACDTPPLPKKPVAVADNATTKKNVLVTIDVQANDTLNGIATTTLTKAPSRGTAVVNNNKIDYTPQKDSCSYSDTLQYKICNAAGCDSANVIIVVRCDSTPLSQKPIARTDNATTKKNTLVTIDVLANDTQKGTLTTFTIINQPKRGTIVSNNYKFDYTPQKDSCNYSDTLQYKICNAGGCDSAFIFVKVNCDSTITGKKPIAVNDNVTTPKNTVLRFKPTANDNINGTLSSVNTVLGYEPKNGDVKYIGLDSLMYTPKKDFCGRDTFRYMVCNTSNLCDSAYVFVNVLCDTTKKPVAIADRATTKKNILVTIDVQANDTLNGVATTTINKAPRRGTAVVNNNKIDYTPQKDSCNYSDTLQYKICNAVGCDSATVIVSVTCPPDLTKKPIAVADNASTFKNKTVTIDILANDTPNGILTATTIVRDPKKGILTFNGNKIDYAPTKDSCGYIDTFQYRICNAIGCDTAFVFVTVSCNIPKTPKAVADSAITIRNKTVVINVLANDTLNGVLITPVVITKNPKFGTINIVANAVVYTPSSGYCGVRDSFQYKICNAQGCDSTYSYVNITCDSTNLLPVANPDSVSTRKNTPIRIVILANDQINGTLDTIKITKSPILGTATLGTDNVLTYTPDSCGFTDSLRYKICNKNGCSETVVKITVICDTTVYKKPKAVADNATTYLNTPVTVDVTANDSLFGAPVDSVKVTTKPNHGKAVVTNGKIVYIPDSCGYSDTLRYAVFTKGGSDTANLIIKILCKRPDSLPPVAVYDVAVGNKNTTLIIDVTANDTLRGSDTFRITLPTKNGTAQFDSLHRIVYIPNKDFGGRDILIYQIANSKGSDTAIVYITINYSKITRDSLPIANRDSAKTISNQPVLISVTANDSLRGATQVVLIDSTMGIHGMATVNADGITVTYTPFRNYFGIDSFRYKICNTYGCDTTTVYVLIDGGDSLIIYNGFSPNGDGMNDVFIIQGIEKYTDNQVTLYNRWGNEVFNVKGYTNDNAWNGKWNNVNVPDGTYFYIILLNDPIKGNIKKAGYVEIKR